MKRVETNGQKRTEDEKKQGENKIESVNLGRYKPNFLKLKIQHKSNEVLLQDAGQHQSK